MATLRPPAGAIQAGPADAFSWPGDHALLVDSVARRLYAVTLNGYDVDGSPALPTWVLSYSLLP